jgi:thioredoxin reductase (NADPH)
MENNIYDVIIIGGGPAGLTAGIYASRERFKTLLLEKAVCGGLPVTTDLIENYPGFPSVTKGLDLMAKFKQQAQVFGTEIIETKEVKAVKKTDKGITVKTDENEYITHALIIAAGSVPKMLNIPGEKEFRGRGVSYCATCDGPFFKDKDVVIIGCGNSGLQEGETLLNYVKSVTFVEFFPFMTAAKVLQERLQKKENVTFMLNHKVTSINGENAVSSITVKDRANDEEKNIKAAGVFVYAGFSPNSAFLKGVVDFDDKGYIKTDESMKTSVDGIYAAGDICSKEVRQITVACGEATIATVAVSNYLREKKS